MWKINSFIWIYFLVKNYIFPFSNNKDWKELYIFISEYNKWGTWGTDQWKISWHLNNSSLILPSDYDEDSKLSKLPNFFESLLTIFFCYIVISMDVDWVYTPVQLLLVFVFLESRTWYMFWLFAILYDDIFRLWKLLSIYHL